VIADMGSFYLIRRINELMKFEASMPLKFDGHEDGLIKCKRTSKGSLKMKNNCCSNNITEIS
jgi:hypothetical protein